MDIPKEWIEIAQWHKAQRDFMKLYRATQASLDTRDSGSCLFDGGRVDIIEALYSAQQSSLFKKGE